MAFGRKSSKITLYTQYYERVFVAHFCSWASMFTLAITLLIIILPFLLTFSTKNFWLKTNSYQEHPSVTYNHKLYTQCLFANYTNDGSLQQYVP
jgi:hypothetical protein